MYDIYDKPLCREHIVKEKGVWVSGLSGAWHSYMSMMRCTGCGFV